MQPVYERGKIAAWIAPPRNGVNGKPFDYDYVHLACIRPGLAIGRSPARGVTEHPEAATGGHVKGGH